MVISLKEPKAVSASRWQKNLLISIGALILITLSNYITIAKYANRNETKELTNNNASSSSSSNSRLLRKANSLTSYWWPSQDDGGLLAKIYSIQHPADCLSPSTKFFVVRSPRRIEKDTRGLTAFAHAASNHLLHALTDGDKFKKFGSRILMFDDLLWPMAKGCANGPETRECYFEPLTNCELSDVDPLHTSDRAADLSDAKDEYDRSIRTLYSARKLWYRLTNSKYSWTGLSGGDTDHSTINMLAATLAYYLRPKPYIREQIDKRLRQSLPADIDPDRTIGVPIRRSDKCKGHNITGSAGGELDCPPLDVYLNGVHQFLDFDPLVENVIVTSEDKAACDEFVELLKKELPQLRIVLNVGDVQQGTGSGTKLEAYVDQASNVDVVTSALTSMHLHLRARYFVITSLSTWTSTIAVMARVYGFASEVYVHDVGRNHNLFSALARKGCEPIHGERMKN
eukprot:scaffold5559_cov158-Skeletonema_menzelii.AAC.4